MSPSSVDTYLDRSDTGIVGPNAIRDMDVCPRFSVLCCSLHEEVLRWADILPKESYQMSKMDSLFGDSNFIRDFDHNVLIHCLTFFSYKAVSSTLPLYVAYSLYTNFPISAG
jgi:hypothetical protein